MRVSQTNVINEKYQPDEMGERVLDHLTTGRDAGEAWGYTSASIAAEALNTRRQYTSRALTSLADAGWVEKVEPPGTGVYRFVEDPREATDE